MNRESIVKLLVGRRILVTGAARGLGFDFAQQFAEAGAKVVLADVLADALTESVGRLKSQGLDVHGVVADLADPLAVKACAEEAVAWLRGLDGLVNNAAITNTGGKPAEELDVELWDKVMNVNVRATWLMSVACRPALAQSGRGAIQGNFLKSINE